MVILVYCNNIDVVSMATGMYFACIMMMCSWSVVFTVLVLNLHYRSPDTHHVPDTHLCGTITTGHRVLIACPPG